MTGNWPMNFWFTLKKWEKSWTLENDLWKVNCAVNTLILVIPQLDAKIQKASQ